MLGLILGGTALRRLAVLVLLALALSTYTLAENADTYKAKCSACHGANGEADTMIGRNLKLRSLASPEVQKLSDDELFVIISKGRNKMPSFDKKLSSDQIHDLVKHIRALKK
ncbi:MAG: cytochrome c [Acidobacteriia bacterium]|nr:cytochrome c [Terriglobia bacterium]